MNQSPDIKADLTQSLKTLHLPTIRQCYEEVARQAEREQLSYERYLHEVVQRECEDRLENRTAKAPSSVRAAAIIEAAEAVVGLGLEQ